MPDETIDADATEILGDSGESPNLPAVRAHEAVVIRGEISVEELLEQRDKIVQAMQRAMTEGMHYGTIPGTPKPTLLKPGAELLNVLFRLAPSYVSEKDWHDDGHLTVTSICTLTHIPSGMVIAGGEGLCSTRESRYAYRGSGRACPECGQVGTIKKSRFAPRPGDYIDAVPTDPPGWYCHSKVGGCGRNFRHDDSRILEQSEERIANPDLADTYNTVLKMADKRALIAAVLNGTAASDVFTQDVGDNGEYSGAAGVSPTPSGATAGAQSPPARVSAPGVPLPAAFPPGPGLGGRIGEALRLIDPSVDWRANWEEANITRYGTERGKLGNEQRAESLHRLAHVAEKLSREDDFPPPSDEEIMHAFAEAFGGEVIITSVARHEPEPLSGEPDPEIDESIEFGDANADK
jgi:hypothetical protein